MSEYTILFADIAGSTALYESVGDERAESIISKALERLSNIVSQYQGRVIKTI
jgi:adenylate cyclase